MQQGHYEASTDMPPIAYFATWGDLWQPTFVSYRRYLLDRCLESHRHLMTGVILDLGGKRDRKRGAFRPPKAQVEHWFYVNIAPETRPDILADVANVPLSGACADCIICTEVLEHLPNPAACVNEAYRMLKPGGVFMASVPFLYPVHADPFDYQRFTADGLRHLCRRFASVYVESMGGYPGVMGMFLELGMAGWKGGWRPARGVVKRLAMCLARSLYWIDQKLPNLGQMEYGYSTGYFIKCVK